mmetsp:Transcript_12672/g.19100  ORF Transcript_12672/g.19100 Transcript_12672/m.19100 type:complete len:245 (+) Transcript_12672:66-800(+)
MRRALANSDRVGEETTQLLRSNISTRNNYQTYSDLCNRALRSLELLTVQGPRANTVPSVNETPTARFRGSVYLPLQFFVDLGDYLDGRSFRSLQCVSKSIFSALTLAQYNDIESGMPMYRIDPSNISNRLRGAVAATSPHNMTPRSFVSHDDLEDDVQSEVDIDSASDVFMAPVSRIQSLGQFLTSTTLLCMLAIGIYWVITHQFASMDNLFVLSAGICLIIVVYMLSIWERLRLSDSFYLTRS